MDAVSKFSERLDRMSGANGALLYWRSSTFTTCALWCSWNDLRIAILGMLMAREKKHELDIFLKAQPDTISEAHSTKQS